MSVRSITVEVLTKLSVNNPTLAIIALAFLVDMFNAELEQDWMKAIEALTAIAQHIQLQVHQLEIIRSGRLLHHCEGEAAHHAAVQQYRHQGRTKDGHHKTSHKSEEISSGQKIYLIHIQMLGG